MADADAAIASFMAITGSADENTARFWVDAAGGNVELAYDACAQAALPWSAAWPWASTPLRTVAHWRRVAPWR